MRLHETLESEDHNYHLFPTTFYHRDEETKRIDASLLCMDFLYIYNCITNKEMTECSLTHPLFLKTRYIDESYATINGWKIYSNCDKHYNAFTSVPIHKDEFDNFASIIQLTDSSYYSTIVYDIYDLSENFANKQAQGKSMSESKAKEMLDQKLFILDDYLETHTLPEKCEKMECKKCIFRDKCPKSDDECPF